MNRWTTAKAAMSSLDGKLRRSNPRATGSVAATHEPVVEAKATPTQPSEKGPLTISVEWASLIETSKSKPADPNWIWAVLSRWRGFARMKQLPAAADPRVRVLLRAETPNQLTAIDAKVIDIPPVYLAHIPGSTLNDKRSRFATGWLARSRLPDLQGADGIEFELCSPLKDQGSLRRGDAKTFKGQQQAIDRPNPNFFAELVEKRRQGQEGETVSATKDSVSGTIAIFDYGCPFLRREFEFDRDTLDTRIQALWHQEEVVAEDLWSEPVALGYGREMRASVLGDIRREVFDSAKRIDEPVAYYHLNYLIDHGDPRRRTYPTTHGAHVLDVIGGCRDRLTGKGSDAASQANLVFVHMPEDTAGDSSGASLGVYLLDALRYTMSVARVDQPLVVNVSYGSTAGPHDGSSIIEEAMDELLEHRPEGFAIVLAAGNSRRLGLHVSRTVAKKSPALFRVHVADGDHTDTFVEFWYPTTFAEHVEFRARLPNGDWSHWVSPNEEAVLVDVADGEVLAALLHRLAVPNGGRRKSAAGARTDLSMALLAIRPTEAPDDDDGPIAEPGLWEIEARLVGSAGNDLHVGIEAWIRRDDSRPFSGRVQSYFLGLAPSDTKNTLSSLACGERTIVVGGFRWSDGMPAGYSSVGPTPVGAVWPAVWGVCERDSIDSGIRAAAVPSQESFLMNGTSVAAPVVARTIFNLMAQTKKPVDQPTLLKRLRGEARKPDSVVRVGD
jgi:hypothetical protein